MSPSVHRRDELRRRAAYQLGNAFGRSIMDQEAIDLVAFDESHLDDAVLLSREAGWPHRREDLSLIHI